jgi:hypothetical protein
MSETAPEPPAPDGGLDQRVTSLEHGQVSILGKLDQLLGMSGPKEPEAERPEVNVAEEIRKQLAERDAKAKKDKPAEPAAPVKADLTEKAPVAPVRRITKFMWGDE